MHISYSRHISFFLSLARKGSSVKSIDATSDLVKVHLSFHIAEDSQKEGWYTEEIKEEKRSITEKSKRVFRFFSKEILFFSN